MIKNIFTIIFLLISFFPRTIFSFDFETLYFNVPSNVQVGDIFELQILMKLADKSVNAVSVEVNFEDENLSFVRANDSGSVITNWVERPEQNGSTIKLSGIIPGGISGTILPQYGTFGDTEIITLLFKAEKEGVVKFNFNEGKLYINDGVGSHLNAFLFEKTVNISGFSGDFKDFKEDNIPPNSFEPKVIQYKGIEGGRFFIIFDTYDLGSGLNRFEISEDGGVTFKLAESPFILNSQSGSKKIIVRAYDNNGNYTDADVPNLGFKNFNFLLFFLIILFLMYFLVKLRKKMSYFRK